MGTLSLNVSNRWRLSPDDFDSLADDILEVLMEETPVDTGNCRDNWEVKVNGNVANFSNETEYASFLNEGWSDQAPNGMIEPTLAQLDDLAEQYQ